MKNLLTVFFVGLNVWAFAQPANNDCANAQAIVIPASGSICVDGTTLTATGTTYTAHPCNTTNVNINEVWFTFITSGSQNNVTVNPTGGQGISQPSVTLYSNGCAGPIDACDMAAVGGSASVDWGYPAGTQIWVNVGGVTADGNFEVCVTSTTPPPAPGDDCGQATVICDMSSFTVADMNGFNSSGTSPSCFFGAANLDAWYQFTIGQSGTLEWTVTPDAATEFDWAMYDITNGCPGTEVDCNYNFAAGAGDPFGMTPGGTGEFNAPINVTQGNTYAILIDNYDNTGGTGYTFDWGNGTATIAPASDFSVTYPACTLPVDATITNNSTAAVSYAWDFGNGNTSTSPNPGPATYNALGTYLISLVTTSATGCTNVFSQPVNVVNCCAMTGLTAQMTDCRNTPFLEYDMEGEVSFTDPPATGQLIVQNCYGQQQVFNAPFTSPQAYSFTSLPQTGENCDITAYFTDDAACTITTPMQAPPPITFYSSNCTLGAGSVNGTVEFTNPNNIGTSLVISIFDGTTTIDTTILPPFTSPQTWSVSGLDPTFNPYTIDYYFTDYQGCAMQQTINCGCAADGGTSTVTMTGNGTNNYILCDGDQISIETNNDWFAPDDVGPIGGYPFQPALVYMVYSCPPTPGVWIGDDPCFVNLIYQTDDFIDNNDLASIFAANGGDATFTDNQIYIVPATAYHYDPGPPAFALMNSNCWDLGPVTTLTYLEPITSTVVPDCQTGAATITLMGGHPENFGTDFTVSNLLPTTATFGNTTCGHNGTITINGLQNGDMYSFDVVDDNGCPHTITGGPFVGLPNANAGVDDTICASLSYNLNPTVSFGTGTWSGPAGITFTPNANTATAVMTAAAAGSYTLTWTEDNGGGCVSTDQVNVVVSNLAFTENITPSTCGNADGAIEINATGGFGTLQYSIDNGVTFQASNVFNGLAAGNYIVVVEDMAGCRATGNVTVSDVGGVTIDNIQTTDVLCFADCNGSISISATGATEFSIDNAASFLPTSVFPDLCPGSYNLVVQDANGCQATAVAVIGEPDQVTYTAVVTDLLCAGQCIGEIDITAIGGTGNLSYSSDNGVTSQLSNVFSNLCAGTYDIIVEDQNGCTATGQEVVNEPPPLTWTFGITDATCFGICDGLINCIPAGGSGVYSYNWSPAAVNINQPLLLNLCAGQYGLTVTDNNGCTLDTTGLTVNAPQAVTINSVTPVDETCFGDCDGSITIDATAATEYSLDGVTYQASNVFNSLCPGNYTVYAQDASGCGVTDVTVISGPSAVDVQAFNDTTICVGGTADLTALATGGVGNYSYSWDSGEQTQNISVSPQIGTPYCVTATDDNGCQSPQACVIVSLNQALNVQAFVDATICEGESTDITALATGGDGGPYTYTWDQNVGVGADQTVSPINSTTYTVTVTDGCETPSAIANVTITVAVIPNISFLADTLEGCVPLTVDFSEVNVPAGSSCLWNFGDGGASIDCNPGPYTYSNVGCWDVTLTITTAEGCVASFDQSNYICTYGYPTPGFTMSPQPTTILNSEIDFTNTSIGATSYIWDFNLPGGTVNDNSIDPTYQFPNIDPGSYEVCLTAISAEGCAADTCDTVVINEEFIVYVPNAFSPNGDDRNEIFVPVVAGVDPLDYEFLVFNRWGQLIFQSEHEGQGWDGTYKGTMSQTDVYVWKLNVRDATTNQTHEYIGHVTLLK